MICFMCARPIVATAIGVALLSASLTVHRAEAQQTAVLTGRVTTDSGRSVRHAGVRIPKLEHVATADASGAFRIEQLAPGTYVLVAEAPGFTAQRVVVTLGAGETRTQDFVLAKGAHLLARVDVRAKAPPRVSPKMVDFERRRLRGLGRFVTRAELARVPGRQLEDVLRSTAVSARFVKAPSGQTWLISSRHVMTSAGLGNASSPDNIRNTVCHVQVVLDGATISSSTAMRSPRVPVTNTTGGGRPGVSDPRTQVEGGDDPIDLNLFFSDQLEGVEFYPDATMTPVEYRTPASVCGTLLLWTRDR
jgi:hypothetical protein